MTCDIGRSNGGVPGGTEDREVKRYVVWMTVNKATGQFIEAASRAQAVEIYRQRKNLSIRSQISARLAKVQ